MPERRPLRAGFTAELDPEGAAPGSFTATVAHIGAINANGWGLEPGAVGRQEVILSNWNHSSTGGILSAGEPPVGSGVFYEDGGLLKADGQYWLDDEPYSAGAYRRTKHLGQQAQFSIFGYANRWHEDDAGFWVEQGGFDAVEFSTVFRGASDHAGYPTGIDKIASLRSSVNLPCIGCGDDTQDRLIAKDLDEAGVAVCHRCAMRAAVLFRGKYGCNDDAVFEHDGNTEAETEAETDESPLIDTESKLELQFRFAHARIVL